MAVLQVPETYATIAEAIAAASPGDTIQIAPEYSSPDGPTAIRVTVDNLTFSGDLNDYPVDDLYLAPQGMTITTSGMRPF